MPNLRCERFGPFDIEELKEELGNLEFEYMMDLAPSKPPTVVRLCECKDEDYEGYHIRLFVGDYEYCVEEGNEAEDVKEMLETMSYETYAEQDLEGIPRFHNWYMALPGKSPYDPTYIEECKIRADAFFKEKEERKKLEEAADDIFTEDDASGAGWRDEREESEGPEESIAMSLTSQLSISEHQSSASPSSNWRPMSFSPNSCNSEFLQQGV